MKIVAISDTHTYSIKDLNLPKADILIHAGDALSSGSESEFKQFVRDISKITDNYSHIIYVPGNHDRFVQKEVDYCRTQLNKHNITLLIDEEVVIDGIKFYGSPYTPRFGSGWAFQGDVEDKRTASEVANYVPFNDIQKYWDNIPEDTNILITHGPPNGIMDISIYSGENCGCPKLLERVKNLKLDAHIFGHIHFYGGQQVSEYGTVFINAAICTERYQPYNNYSVLEIK